MNEQLPYRDPPPGWDDIAGALAPAPPCDWHVSPPVVSPTLQPALGLLDERQRTVLALWVDGEAAASIGDLFGIDEDQVRRIELHTSVTLIGATASLRRECSAWLRDATIHGSAIVRFADARLDLGAWGTVPEATAWRMLLWLLCRPREPYLVVPLDDGRHVILEQAKHRPPRVESWLRKHGRFATGSEVEHETGVPSILVTRAPDAFDGVLATRGGLLISKHLRSVEFAHAVICQLARLGCRAWHEEHLGSLLVNLHPDRFRDWSPRDFRKLIDRLPVPDLQPGTEPGWWHFRGDVDPTPVTTRTSDGGPPDLNDLHASSSVVGKDDDAAVPDPGARSSGDRGERQRDADTSLEPCELVDQLADAVAAILRDSPVPLSITQLAAATGAIKRDVHRVLFRVLSPQGIVFCTDGLRWTAASGDDPDERNPGT